MNSTLNLRVASLAVAGALLVSLPGCTGRRSSGSTETGEPELPPIEPKQSRDLRIEQPPARPIAPAARGPERVRRQ